MGRNPYFSGFSLAMMESRKLPLYGLRVAILILVDFPLQFLNIRFLYFKKNVAILILVDFPLQLLENNFNSYGVKAVAILILVDFPLQLKFY